MVLCATTMCSRCIPSLRILITRCSTFMLIAQHRLMFRALSKLARWCTPTLSKAELISHSCNDLPVVPIPLASVLSVSLAPAARANSVSKRKPGHVLNAGLLTRLQASLAFRRMASHSVRNATNLDLLDLHHLRLPQAQDHQTHAPHIRSAQLWD